MAVAIRLSRSGAKKRPFYRIVAIDRRKPRDGSYLEKLGHFNPAPGGSDPQIVISQERFDYWVGVGAQPSERVISLIKKYKKAPTAEAQKVLRQQKLDAANKKRQAKKAMASSKDKDTDQDTDATQSETDAVEKA